MARSSRAFRRKVHCQRCNCRCPGFVRDCIASPEILRKQPCSTAPCRLPSTRFTSWRDFAVGFLVGMTGVGGGALMTPLLILLFHVHPTTAVGTDLLYASITKTGGSLVHGFNRNIDWRIVGRLALGISARVASDAAGPAAAENRSGNAERRDHPAAGRGAVGDGAGAGVPPPVAGRLCPPGRGPERSPDLPVHRPDRLDSGRAGDDFLGRRRARSASPP